MTLPMGHLTRRVRRLSGSDYSGARPAIILTDIRRILRASALQSGAGLGVVGAER